MSVVLLFLALAPVAVALLCIVLPHRTAGALTLGSGLACLAATVALVPGVDGGVRTVGFLRADPLSVVFLLPTGFLYAAAAAYSIGYLADEARHAARVDGAEAMALRRYSRLFHVGINLFAWSMLCAPMANGLALLWIAIEVTTVVSALLVALDNTEGATEAAWKYVLIASCGLGIALLATIVMYYAGEQPLGRSYDLALDPLIAHAAALPATPVRLAFVLAVVGFGTKVGLVPMHTWLPDAHAEAPTPVSALLSGALLAVSFYAVLRYYQVAQVATGAEFPRAVLLVFGLASLLLAALSLLRQTDLKRLLAYSSVEHMGILAIGVSFGARLAMFGVLLHVLCHAAAKGNAFFGAGIVVRAYGTKTIARIHGLPDRLPWSGPLLLAAVLALCALPPFGLFRSELDMVAGGVLAGHEAAAGALVVLVLVAFLGLLGTVSSMTLAPAPVRRRELAVAPAGQGGATGASREEPAASGRPARGGEPSWWMVLPPVAGIVVLVVLGIHPPAELSHLLETAAGQLAGVGQ